MPVVKLKDSGAIHWGDEPLTIDGSGLLPTSIEKRAVLVYAGTFASMDGPVEVTTEQLVRLVANHNSLLSRVPRLAKGLKGCPPVQLDHSTSARDTVGRLVGPLELGAYELEDGTSVPAVYGLPRILGRENVERVADGRWIHLSIGADFEAGKVSELTITPFPAAAEASMLSKGGATSDEQTDGGGAATTEVKSDTQPTEETHTMKNRDKLKKYLTETKKLSEADAEKELSRLGLEENKEELSRLEAEDDENDKRLTAEADEAEKKRLAAESDEKEKAEKEKTEKLTAARGKLTQLTAGFRGVVDGARLAARQGRILTRLSKLRAEAKITPAEVKKIDVAKLAGENDSSIELVLKTYSDREPVIMVGQLGSIKGANLAAEGKQAKMAQLEAETRANMSLLSKSAPSKLADGGAHTATENPAERPGMADDEDTKHMEREYAELSRLMDEGKGGEAKDRLKAFMVKCSRSSLSSGDFVEANAVETEKHLSSLAENVTKMQAQFDELHQLTASLLG
jgi:hypothetical protein